MARKDEGEFQLMCAAVRFITEQGLLEEFHRQYTRLIQPITKEES